MTIAVPSKLCLASSGVALAVVMLTTTPSKEQSQPPLEHVEALLLIVGCYDDLSQCSELPPLVSLFETKEDCDRQLPKSLGAFTEDFEQLFAQCLPVDPAMDEEDARLRWEVHPDGTLAASVEAAPFETTEPPGALVALAGTR